MIGNSVRYEHATQHPPIPDNRLVWCVLRIIVASAILLTVWYVAPEVFQSFGGHR